MKSTLIGVALLCLAVCVLADEEKKPEDYQKCTPLQRVKVRRQWDHAFGEGKHRIEFAQHLFHELFKEHPEARKLFAKYRSDNIYHPTFMAWSQRVLNGIGMIIDTADDPEANKVIVAKLKVYLAEQGLDSNFYNSFRDEMMESIPHYLEDHHFDWDAWLGCLNLIVNALH